MYVYQILDCSCHTCCDLIGPHITMHIAK